MRLRKLFMLIMFLIILTSLQAEPTDYDIPYLEVPENPEYQHGDDELVPVTVGEMRQALFYFNLTPYLIESYNEVADIAYKYALEADEQAQVKRCWRNTAIVLAAMLAISTTVNVLR